MVCNKQSWTKNFTWAIVSCILFSLFVAVEVVSYSDLSFLVAICIELAVPYY